MPKKIAEQIDEFGRLLHNLFIELTDHPSITDTFDYILGSLHGLVQAHRLGFKNRSTQYVPVIALTWRTMLLRSRKLGL